jgi:D-lyxose ketol-isomerase
MKRSLINAQIDDAIAFIESMGTPLPPLARFTPGDWAAAGHEWDEARENAIGWDVTTFGSDDFYATGLVLFTLRNGNLASGDAKTYAEKILVVREGQVTPFHFHKHKMEDIINRGGGNLVVRLFNTTDNGEFADTDIEIRSDGRRFTIPAGGTFTLKPGESFTAPQYTYHSFWGEPGFGTVLVGEVSAVNDDTTDNRFYEERERFNTVIEDEPARFLLANEYPPAPEVAV